tara:strand:- start:1349 stop:2134 length:786 start_codon:yes stop_codon:yes gene_type:complete
MKILTLTRLLFALASIFPFSLASADEGKELRILSYNIHAGIGTDKVYDLERIAAVIKSTNPHIVALQEVDKETKRSRGIDIAKKLGELTGMKSVFGASIEIGGGEYGNAILTTLDIEKTETLPIPQKIEVEQRSILSANLAFNGKTIQVLATHFCHRETTNRVAAAEFIAAQQAPAGTASFVIGDLNALPESEPLKILAKAGWQNPAKSPVFTFPSAKPNRQIDYVLVRPAKSENFAAKTIEVVDEAVASDHRPLLVVFEP